MRTLKTSSCLKSMISLGGWFLFSITLGCDVVWGGSHEVVKAVLTFSSPMVICGGVEFGMTSSE